MGQLSVHGNVRSGHMLMRGNLEADGDWEGDRLTVKGAFRVGGLLNAEQMDIRLFGPSSAREIGGGAVKVGRSRLQSLKEFFVPAGPAVLTAESVEADQVELSYTKAQTVRGNRVVIGPGCTIGEVEYTESLEVHKSSKISRHTRK